jgi:hypothetical protein
MLDEFDRIDGYQYEKLETKNIQEIIATLVKRCKQMREELQRIHD